MRKRIFHIPVFVPHRGCTHDCVFCNQRKITGIQTEMTSDDAREVIEKHLKTIEKYNPKGSYYAEIAFFGGSFTAIELQKQAELLALAFSYVKDGRVGGIRCSTRPDAINEEILENCKRYGVTAIELGVQSADDEVLLASNRGHTFDDVIRASDLIKSYGIELGLQMMLGLPKDSYEKSLATARRIAALNPKCVRIYPTLVMEDTMLWHMYKDGSYTPLDLDFAIGLSADVAEIFISNNIGILRIALQTTDGVNEKTVIGPYHPAFAELVYSELEKRKIEAEIKSKNIHDTEFYVRSNGGNVSKIIGHKKSNKIYFKQKYNVDLKIREL